MVSSAAVTPGIEWLLVATLVVWFVGESRQSRRSRPEATPAGWGTGTPIRVATAVGVLGAFGIRRALPSADLPSGAAVGWIALALLWCGVGLRFWSFATLGRYFTFTVQTSPDQPVVSSGPYRFVRHPGYAGVLVAVVGAGVLIGNWVSLAFLVTAVLVGLVLRIRIEERALSADLGGRYQAYARGRSRLVPGVW